MGSRPRWGAVLDGGWRHVKGACLAACLAACCWLLVGGAPANQLGMETGGAPALSTSLLPGVPGDTLRGSRCS